MSLLRPQPLGVLPLPAGALLLPDAPGAEEVAGELACGRVPQAWPAGLEFYGAAAAGDVDGALGLLEHALAAVPDGSAALVLRFDRFVLAPTAQAHEELRPALAADPQLAPLLHSAAFVAGVLDAAPAPAALAPLDGELRAAALLAVAADALEHGRGDQVAALLTEAVDAATAAAPAAAAQLLGTLAGLHADAGQGTEAAQLYARAIALLGPEGLPVVRAELLYGRGIALQSVADGRSGVLKEAVRCYQQALRTFRRESHPELFAEAQSNLALAYLATPMVDAGDHLRLGIAVQALREALTVWQRETHPQQWASVTLNLANALQHLPSVHQEDNLAEAVGLYEELLTVRDPERDPAGCARVLANQGNALAHLGILDHAREKLLTARELFTRAGDTGSARALEGTLSEVAVLGDRLAGGAGVRGAAV